MVLANQFFSTRDVFGGLLADLAPDHRMVSYDLRGTGESSREGPYDIATDALDLAALIEQLGEPAVVLGLADGCNRAVQGGRRAARPRQRHRQPGRQPRRPPGRPRDRRAGRLATRCSRR